MERWNIHDPNFNRFWLIHLWYGQTNGHSKSCAKNGSFPHTPLFAAPVEGSGVAMGWCRVGKVQGPRVKGPPSSRQIFKEYFFCCSKIKTSITHIYYVLLQHHNFEFHNEIKNCKSVKDILVLLLTCDVLSSLPELRNACVLFCTLPVTVFTAERSFSKLKLIKSYLRSSIAQDRLDSLALISIENKAQPDSLT